MNKNLTLFLVLVVCSSGAWGVYNHFHQSTNISQSLFSDSSIALATALNASSSTPVNVAEAIARPAPPPEGYVKYENTKYGFYYYHSPEAKITEFDEGGGAMTIVQENLQKVRGLQIFIVPYSQPTISEERFKMDEPSGVRTNVQNTRLGVLQIPAVTFNSYDASLGDTREVWFIHNGYLFEVTTFKGVGDWFSPIMQTWRFI